MPRHNCHTGSGCGGTDRQQPVAGVVTSNPVCVSAPRQVRVAVWLSILRFRLSILVAALSVWFTYHFSNRILVDFHQNKPDKSYKHGEEWFENRTVLLPYLFFTRFETVCYLLTTLSSSPSIVMTADE